MEEIKPFETRGESEEDLIKREVSDEIEAEMAVHKNEPFHNERHPKNVGRDALRIVDIFENYTDQVTPDTHLEAKTAADMHDVIVDFVVVTDPKAFNYGQRIRLRGFGEFMPENVKKILAAKGETIGNEEKSWKKGEEIIKKHDPEGKVYTPEVMTAIQENVAATTPDAKMEPLPKEYVTEKGEVLITNPRTGEAINIAPYLGKDANEKIMALHFSQIFLTKKSKISTIGVAYGDIMYGGKVNFERFTQHGNEEFRELYELIRKDIEAGVDQLTPERKSEIAKAALGWISTQVGFLMWQKIEFKNGLEHFEAIQKSKDPEALRGALSDEYSMFDSNIIDSIKRVETARARFEILAKPIHKIDPEFDDTFKELMLEMGF